MPLSRSLFLFLGRVAAALGLAATLVLPALPASAQPVSATLTTPHVTAELLAHAPQGLSPGATVWLGLRLTHQPDWHTYWKNAGDSGLPTDLRWTLPAGLSAGEIAWPLPHKFPIGPLANYGYDGTVLLPVPLTVDAGLQPSPLGNVDVRLHASWLVCRVECIPEEGDFLLRLPAHSSTALHGAAFDAALASQPQPLPASTASRLTIDDATPPGALDIVLDGLPPRARGRDLALFVETPEVIETGAAWQQQWQGSTWHARVPLSAYRAASPALIPVVVTLDGGSGGLQGWRAELPVQGTWPPPAPPALAAAPAPLATTALAAPPISAAPLSAYLLALAGAFLGGLLLNLMPCVFPVLAIKALSVLRQDRTTLRQTGLAYTAGVLVSFLLLAGLLLALRAGGQALGWGFQLQSPAVVAGLAALFTVLGLNLAGLFHIGNLLPAGLAGRQLHHPTLDAAFSGVLAVAVASPCTAPFMGASLGFTLTLPAGQTLLLFAAMGLGLALPFLLLSLAPGAGRWLPRPGAWMETLRQFLAFPLFGTVAWLLWVLGQQSGSDGVAALAALLVALALLLWAGSLPRRAGRWGFGALAAATLLVLGAWLGPAVVREAPPAAQAAESGWQPWSAAREQALLAEGRTVFVDYTAAWCITCQYNKKTTLADAQVLAQFDAAGVALLRADWTRRDAAITTSLAALGRNGVPAYVLRRPGQAAVVLPEILSREAIEQALASR